MGVRIALSLIVLLASSPAVFANEPTLLPEQAVSELARYCVDTGASSAKLETELKAIKLPEHDIQAVINGTNVNMRLRLSDDYKLDVTYVRGQSVVNCFMHFYLADVEGTMVKAGQRFGISGKLEDHTSLNFDSALKVAPGLLGVFDALKMETDSTGSLTVVIIPEATLR